MPSLQAMASVGAGTILLALGHSAAEKVPNAFSKGDVKMFIQSRLIGTSSNIQHSESKNQKSEIKNPIIPSPPTLLVFGSFG